MKVNADIYCLHSASFQSHVKARESLTLTEEALLHNIRAGAQRQPWDYNVKDFFEPCKGSAIGERFQRFAPRSHWCPRVVAALQPWAETSEPWAEISERLRRSYSKIKLHHYQAFAVDAPSKKLTRSCFTLMMANIEAVR
jgi:hypothetical protein